MELTPSIIIEEMLLDKLNSHGDNIYVNSINAKEFEVRAG
jgi:hypothetical protein